MTPDKILMLLKSGIWEDALIAFNLMKDWTLEDVINRFPKAEPNTTDFPMRVDLGDSSHIKDTVKINENLYMFPGKAWSIFFTNTLGGFSGSYITI